MVSKYVREQKRYSQAELARVFECPEEKTVPIIKRLKEYNVLKAVSATETQKNLTDLQEKDVEIADVEEGEDQYYYVFTFVGIIVVSGIVLKCIPKYILHHDEPKDELKQIIKVLEKYNSKEQIVRMFNEANDSKSFNLLAVLLFLLHDFYENGSYSNTEEIIESNGAGEILWEKTINETFTLFSDNRPYYIDLQTKKRVRDEYDYFKRLHESVLTIASKELIEADVLELFELLPVNLSEETLEDFGEDDYILDRIEKDLSTQFNTRKQLVLKTLYAYVKQSGNLYDIEALSLYGTNSFNLVWEDVCGVIMDNQLDKPLDELNMNVSLADEYPPKMKLIEVIDHPFWCGEIEGITFNDKKETLIPDIISLYHSQKDVRCVIIDAKYYTLHIDRSNHIQGQPGIESISKQYLYQMAYVKFLEDHGITYFSNCFLMPTEGKEIVNIGYVSLEFMSKLNLADIQIRLLPAEVAYGLYLDNKKLDINELDL